MAPRRLNTTARRAVCKNVLRPFIIAANAQEQSDQPRLSSTRQSLLELLSRATSRSSRSRSRKRDRIVNVHATRWALTLLALGAIASPLGCALVEQRQPSQVSQGRRFHTAAKEFDEFFVGLHEAQVLVQRWPKGEHEPRRKLLRRLGLEPDASSRDASYALGNEIRALESSDLYLNMRWQDLEGSVEAELEVDGRTPNHAEQRLIDSLEAEARAIGALYAKLHGLDDKVDRLREQRQALSAKVDETFQAEGVTKLQIVRKNLDDAAAVLNALELKIEVAFDELEDMISILENQVQAQPPPPEPEEAAEEAEEAPARPSYKPRRSRPRATPTPDEPPPTKPNDEFEP